MCSVYQETFLKTIGFMFLAPLCPYEYHVLDLVTN